MISHVKGAFKTFDGSIYTTDKDFTTAVIDIWIEAASITTGDEKRDEHLKSDAFFDVEKHPQISFTSSTIGAADAQGIHELWGAFTMRGVTKNLKLEVKFGGLVKDPWGNEKAGFEVSGKLNRSEWGLAWNTAMETGGLVVGDEVSISVEMELLNLGAQDLTMELEPSNSNAGIF